MRYLLAGLLLGLALAGIVACGDGPASETPQTPTTEMPAPTATDTPQLPTATPAEPAATETPPPPTATPAVPPATETPQRPTATTPKRPATERPEAPPTEISRRPNAGVRLDHPAALLSLLPVESTQVIFVEAGRVLQRHPLRQEVQHGIEILAGKTAGVLSEELLLSADINSAAFGITAGYSGVAILLGDFERFPEALRQAPSAAKTDRRFSPPSALDSYRGVELFVFPGYDPFFVAVPDSGALLLADSALLLREIIDRRLDGGGLDEALAGLLGQTGPIDFLIATRFETENGDQGDGSAAPPAFHAHAGSLNEGETSTIFAYMQFNETAHAEQAMEWLAEQEDLSGLFWGYNAETSKPTGEVRREGLAVIAEAVVPDKDVPDLFLSN